MSEQKQIDALIRGDRYSFDLIYYKYHKKVYDFTLRNLGDRIEAENVVQEVFISLWKSRAKLKELNDMDAWIFTICFNYIRKYFRKLAREREHLQKYSEMILTVDSSSETEIVYNDLKQKVDQIIDRLPNRQKSVILLKLNENLSNSEIADRLKIEVKTVENHITRARSFIRNSIVDERLISLFFFWFFLQ